MILQEIFVASLRITHKLVESQGTTQTQCPSSIDFTFTVKIVRAVLQKGSNSLNECFLWQNKSVQTAFRGVSVE